ncbi:hypothetical protein [Methylobacterium indicum]|uniref:Uncharacterized protein n=1 Tax=Methylobacterium indicum TaxID=1775910 RepID=A0A8H9C680_9HYPH|nr:hypothetical protein [Methylobacterium indicum]BCM83613.1 hypothetical protein mvi_20740 [Methylobacterium indicum]
MSHLRLVSDSAPPAPEPAMPRPYAPPPVQRELPVPTSAFGAHESRLAPRKNDDRVPVPPGGRAHVTCSMDDLDFEQGVIIALERLAQGRELRDGLGKPVVAHEVERYAGLRAAGLAGLQARIRPHLRMDHPWQGQAAELMERLASEERHWWTVSGRRRT